MNSNSLASSQVSAQERLIVALDFPNCDQARSMVETLGDSVSFYKIGMQLCFAGGLELIRELKSENKQIFLDMKLLDISNTMAGAIGTLSDVGVDFTTIHAYPHAMKAAVAANKSDELKILAVTVLTSLDKNDLDEAGYNFTPQELILKRAKYAADCCISGVVASPLEARMIREEVGSNLTVVTPGIRPSGSEAGDQKRIATPQTAIQDGADYLVVGRPITQAKNPNEVARSIVEEIAKAV